MKNPTIRFMAILTIVGLAAVACKPKESADSGIRYVAPKDGLNMRTEPSVTGKKMLTIPKGAQVQKFEEKPESFKIDNIDGKWTKISWQGKTGWVFGGFLSMSEPASNESATSASATNDATQCQTKCEEQYQFWHGTGGCEVIVSTCNRTGTDEICKSEGRKCFDNARVEKETCLSKCS